MGNSTFRGVLRQLGHKSRAKKFEVLLSVFRPPTVGPSARRRGERGGPPPPHLESEAKAIPRLLGNPIPLPADELLLKSPLPENRSAILDHWGMRAKVGSASEGSRPRGRSDWSGSFRNLEQRGHRPEPVGSGSRREEYAPMRRTRFAGHRRARRRSRQRRARRSELTAIGRSPGARTRTSPPGFPRTPGRSPGK